MPPETKDGGIPAVLMRDLCSSSDSVIGFIKGALDGPFFLCMFTPSDWSDNPDLLGGGFFAKRSGGQPKVCYGRKGNEPKGGESEVV